MLKNEQQLKQKIVNKTILAFFSLLAISIFITPSVFSKEIENTPSQFNAKVVTNYEPSFHSEWKKSSKGVQQATIEGKGDPAIEEGEAVLVIENLQTKKTTIYQLKNNEFSQYTPKYIEWIDENRLFVIIGYAYGTVTTGGKLYKLNIKNNTVTPIIEDLLENEEIMAAKVNNDGTFTYKKHVYDSDNYEEKESHIEEIRIPLPKSKAANK
ncbi:DUF4652 domain-containing protein [Psychrobacillus sp. NPDC096389]|uniref:DUF4652 domain-containing protein n=1 Tax=Psychrobacillus sp. NPDC096389 TaxID=3364490 RepID=UPI0038198A99